MSKFLICWVVNGTLNFGKDIERLKTPMTKQSLEDLEKILRKRHSKPKLTILAFSKFEGEDLPVINVQAVRKSGLS